VLLVQGDADKGYHNSVTAYPQLAAPKWFVTLHGSLHSPPFELPRGSEAPVVDSVTTAFWSTYLSAQPSDARAITQAVRAAGDRASLVHHA
jgi:hypothetical protein